VGKLFKPYAGMHRPGALNKAKTSYEKADIQECNEDRTAGKLHIAVQYMYRSNWPGTMLSITNKVHREGRTRQEHEARFQH
jgi:hypothetical protein